MKLASEDRIRLYTDAGWWGETTLWQLFQRQLAGRADQLAVADACNREDFMPGAPQRLSWKELADRVDRACLMLLRSGFARDDIVVVQLPNCVEQFALYLACARLGIIVSPVPAQYREHELAQILDLTAARGAICCARIGRVSKPHDGDAMFRNLRASHPALQAILAVGDTLLGETVSLDAWLARPCSDADRQEIAVAEAAAGIGANDIFTICWTSGTEAFPKGVPRSHNEWRTTGTSIIESAELTPGMRLLNPFPLVNMAGISTAFISWLELGASVIQHHPFSLDVFLRQLREENVDYTVAAPAILNTLLQNEHMLEGISFSRLKRIGSGSAPLSEWMVKSFAERHGVQIVNYYGSNEGAALSGSHVDIPDPALRAQFFPRAGVPGYEWHVSTSRKIRTRLVDPDSGQEISEPGRPGELRVSGPTIFSGYFNSPDMTARAFDTDGYYRTGDLFEIAGDRSQYYRFVGRSKDLIIRGGMNISAEEVESLLLCYPGVMEAAVVGIPDDVLGERLCACVVEEPGAALDLPAINEFLHGQKRVAVYKLPEHLLRFEALPRNPVGKLLKRELRSAARAMLTCEETQP
ncbi:class I adenylate-forming enzyme family protein [Pigmentiphaga daeguensis]|uniref:Class I adenylate-forming enzyme family protein n=1 Tax=Pigmentiphaga daeguensis TaxID=414049 RepID=A0ABN1BS29_9BURK